MVNDVFKFYFNHWSELEGLIIQLKGAAGGGTEPMTAESHPNRFTQNFQQTKKNKELLKMTKHKKIVEKVLIDFFEIGKKFLWAEKTWEGILDELKTLLLELLCNKLFWRLQL